MNRMLCFFARFWKGIRNIVFPQKRIEREEEENVNRILRFSQTLAIALFIVWVAVSVHLVLFREYYGDAWKSFDVPGNFYAPIIVFEATIVVVGFTAFLSAGYLMFGEARWRINKILLDVLVRIFGLLAGISIALICYYTGGMILSPFVPLLAGFGLIALIFAEHPLNKMLLAVAAIVPYLGLILFADSPYEFPQSMFVSDVGRRFSIGIFFLTIGLSYAMYELGRPRELASIRAYRRTSNDGSDITIDT